MKTILFLLMMLAVSFAHAQEEQALEDIAEQTESAIEDDSHLQQLEILKKHRLNLNTATAEDLKNLQMLNAMQVKAIIQYRELCGNLIHLYELQAIPNWDVATIQKLLPYITITEPAFKLPGKSSGTLLLRLAQNFDKMLLRYRCNYKNVLQYGVLAEKDAGESLKHGFDFYSFHIFIRKQGLVRSIALGDFTVNMGQGLIQWQTLSLGKGGDLTGAKRQSAVLRPYSSAGEYNFHRGMAVSLEKRRLSATAFVSLRRLDANLAADSAQSPVITSFLTSGLHRTEAELSKRHNTRQQTLGGAIVYDHSSWRLGANFIHYRFSHPVQKRDEPYNLFAFRGSRLTNASMDYDYTFRNLHGFGEVAYSLPGGLAMVHGLLASLDRRVDASLVFRHITPSFQSFYSAAFTESSRPNNESGAFAGLAFRPGHGLTINCYADIFRFPWLKSGVDAPSAGREYMVQAILQPTKQLDISTRWRFRARPANFNLDQDQINSILPTAKTNWRLHVNWRPAVALLLRQRLELVWFNRNKPGAEQGYLIYHDLVYDPPAKAFKIGGRLEFFETNGFNSRIYAFENDIPSSYSINAVYHKGVRYLVNLQIDLGNVFLTRAKQKFFHVQGYLKWAHTINEMQMGTEFEPEGKKEMKLQIIFSKV